MEVNCAKLFTYSRLRIPYVLKPELELKPTGSQFCYPEHTQILSKSTRIPSKLGMFLPVSSLSGSPAQP